MPADLRRRDDITAAVDAYNRSHPELPSATPSAARLLSRHVSLPKTSASRASRRWGRRASSGTISPGRYAPWSRQAWCRDGQHIARAIHLPASSAGAGAVVRGRREKIFGPGRAVPLDGNAKARIQTYARVWSGRNRRPGQQGPITRAFLEVLEALLWGFHNARTGCCFPSYETIAAKAECGRTTVYEALQVLELAGVLSWQHRLTRIRERCTDLFGRNGWRWRVIRTYNAYVFLDPASEFGNRTGTLNQDVPMSSSPPAIDPDSPLERALARFGAAIAGRLLAKGSGGPQRSRRLTQVCSFELTQRLQSYRGDHCRLLLRVGAASVVVPLRASRSRAAAALVGT